MDIIQFLSKELTCSQKHGMITILPKSIIFHFLVIGSREMKSVKHPITTAFLQISLQFIQNPFARELLKITDNISQWKLFPCTDNCM